MNDNTPHALCIPDNQGYKHTICNIYCPRQQWLRERVSVLRYTHIVRLVHFNTSIYQIVGSNMLSSPPVVTLGGGGGGDLSH
jgi:hypothetical protein